MILSHHDLLATDDIDAGGKSLEGMGILAHQLTCDGENIGGLSSEEGLGGDALDGRGGRDGQFSVGVGELVVVGVATFHHDLIDTLG